MGNKNLSFKLFLKNFFTEVVSIDNRIINTLKILISKPGYLTYLHFNSSEEKYIPPIKLYFIINFVFFLVIPILTTSQFQIFNFNLESLSGRNQIYQNIVKEEIQASNVTPEIYTERFNTHIKYNQPALIFLIVPFFALLLKIIFLTKKRYYLEHLYFALDYLSFFLISLTLATILYRLLTFGLSFLSGSQGVVAAVIPIVLLIGLSIYLYVSLKTFYKNTTLSNIIVYPFILVGFFISIGVYVQFLFFYTVLVLKWSY
ncbi:MAG: DUF3667 domain-containing protein [Ignavibacteriae bacterium]|nr:DUF3667 domain-containing protein [Ignavibacteriota bacterium]MCB0748846.1 DUF3667 domain-containing protein [Ignavibacteriota bacterium]